MRFATIFICVAPALLAACGAKIEPNISAADVNAAQVTLVQAQDMTRAADVPVTGSAHYAGRVGGWLAADYTGGFLGDLALDVDFANNDVTGDVRNVNLIAPDGTPDQLLKGHLDVAGYIRDAWFRAHGEGDLTASDGVFSGTATAMVDFYGTFRGEGGTPDTIAGMVTGHTEGDYMIVVTKGGFYAFGE